MSTALAIAVAELLPHGPAALPATTPTDLNRLRAASPRLSDEQRARALTRAAESAPLGAYLATSAATGMRGPSDFYAVLGGIAEGYTRLGCTESVLDFRTDVLTYLGIDCESAQEAGQLTAAIAELIHQDFHVTASALLMAGLWHPFQCIASVDNSVDSHAVKVGAAAGLALATMAQTASDDLDSTTV